MTMAKKIEKIEATDLVYATDDPDRIVVWPCFADVPMADGVVARKKFDCAFKIAPSERVEQYVKDFASSDIGGAAAMLALVDEYLTGFPTLKTEGGIAPDYQTVKASFCAKPFMLRAMVEGLLGMSSGREAKN